MLLLLRVIEGYFSVCKQFRFCFHYKGVRVLKGMLVMFSQEAIFDCWSCSDTSVFTRIFSPLQLLSYAFRCHSSVVCSSRKVWREVTMCPGKKCVWNGQGLTEVVYWKSNINLLVDILQTSYGRLDAALWLSQALYLNLSCSPSSQYNSSHAWANAFN